MQKDDGVLNPKWPLRAADLETLTGLKYNSLRIVIGKAEDAIPGFRVRPTRSFPAIMIVQFHIYSRLVELGLSALQAIYVAFNEKLELEIERDITKRYSQNAEKTLRDNQPEEGDGALVLFTKQKNLDALKADCFLIVDRPQIKIGDVTLSDFDIVLANKLDLLYQPTSTHTMYHGTPYNGYATVHFERRDIATRTEWVEPHDGKDLWGELPETDRQPLSDSVRLVNLTRLIRSTSVKLMNLYPDSAVRILDFFAGPKPEGQE